MPVSPALLRPKQVKRLRRLLTTMDRAATMLGHPDLEHLKEWNGDRNLYKNLTEFINWQESKLPREAD